MKKVICVLAISLMVISTCQAKTIEWTEAGKFKITEEVTEEKESNLESYIDKLDHEIQQCQAKSDYQLMLKAGKETEKKDIETALNIVKVDGVYTTK